MVDPMEQLNKMAEELGVEKIWQQRRPVPIEVGPGGSGIGRRRRKRINEAGHRQRVLKDKREQQKRSDEVKKKSKIKVGSGHTSPRPNRGAKKKGYIGQ
ncbi:MAG: hypothetical protein Q8O55_02270 [Dehalococcoidales bacterium]|nr:hypothetical protein [Dehalococcoidales bacterium]